MTKKQSRRGRPAQLSRDQVLGAALQLLQGGPDKVTISGVARVLKAAPMSLYTHVKNRDDLLLGVSDLVLGRVHVEVADNAIWQEQVKSWLFQVHEQLALYPQVASLLGEAQSLPPQWLRVHGLLIRYLVGAGFSGEQLSYIAIWLAQLMISDIVINSPQHTQLKQQAVVDAMEDAAIEDRESFKLILHHADKVHRELFGFIVEQAMVRVAALLVEGDSEG